MIAGEAGKKGWKISGRAGRLGIATVYGAGTFMTIFILDQKIVKPVRLGASDIAADMANQIFTRRRFTIMLQSKSKHPLKPFIPFVPVRNQPHNAL